MQGVRNILHGYILPGQIRPPTSLPLHFVQVFTNERGESPENFSLGPVMRRLEPSVRAGVIAYLVPRTLLFFPMVSLTAGTAGWFLAVKLGLLASGNPLRPWVILALAMVLVMTAVGLGVLLPNSFRIWRELGGATPDRERIVRLNGINLRLAGLQGLMQVAIILVMAHLAF